MMKLYLERDKHAWNKVVEASPYAVLHHKYEVFTLGGNCALPLVFEREGNYISFPFRLDRFLRFRSVTVPIYDAASILPSSSEAISFISESLDFALRVLRGYGVDLLTVSAPFLLPRRYKRVLDSWFKRRNASVQFLFMDVLNTKGKSFEEIWKMGFSKHARNRARKAEKEGVCVHEVESFEDWVSDMYLCNVASFYRQRRYPRYPHSDERAFLVYLNKHKELLKESFKVYGAFFRGRLIAYLAALEFNRLITVTLTMSLSEFMSKCPNDALLKHLIQHACKNGFDWIYYSFDRVRYGSSRPSLHTSLRKFKFEHGFQEYPMKVYFLGVTRSGSFLQWLISVYNFMFMSSPNFPSFVTDALQKIYEMLRYRKSRYKYVVAYFGSPHR